MASVLSDLRQLSTLIRPEGVVERKGTDVGGSLSRSLFSPFTIIGRSFPLILNLFSIALFPVRGRSIRSFGEEEVERMGEESVSVCKEGKEGKKSRVALFARKEIEGWNFSATDQKERRKRREREVREGIREELVRGEVSVEREGRRRRLTCFQLARGSSDRQHSTHTSPSVFLLQCSLGCLSFLSLHPSQQPSKQQQLVSILQIRINQIEYVPISVVYQVSLCSCTNTISIPKL